MNKVFHLVVRHAAHRLHAGHDPIGDFPRLYAPATCRAPTPDQLHHPSIPALLILVLCLPNWNMHQQFGQSIWPPPKVFHLSSRPLERLVVRMRPILQYASKATVALLTGRTVECRKRPF